MSRPSPLVELLAHLTNIRLALAAVVRWQKQGDEQAAAARADTAARLEALAVGLAELTSVGEDNYLASNAFAATAGSSFDRLRDEVHQLRRNARRRPPARVSIGPRLRGHARPRAPRLPTASISELQLLDRAA